jgi:hypothetical protein
MAISSILDELWTEWSSVSFWMYYDQNGHQFLFGLTMNRMPISSILDELWSEWTEWSSSFCDCTRSILDEWWTEQPSVPIWMNYGQNKPSVSFWMNYRQNGYQLNLHNSTSSILDELWTEWPLVPFGWTMDRMVISSILDELWTEWPHQFHFGSTGAAVMGAHSLWSHFFLFFPQIHDPLILVWKLSVVSHTILQGHQL